MTHYFNIDHNSKLYQKFIKCKTTSTNNTNPNPQPPHNIPHTHRISRQHSLMLDQQNQKENINHINILPPSIINQQCKEEGFSKIRKNSLHKQYRYLVSSSVASEGKDKNQGTWLGQSNKKSQQSTKSEVQQDCQRGQLQQMTVDHYKTVKRQMNKQNSYEPQMPTTKSNTSDNMQHHYKSLYQQLLTKHHQLVKQYHHNLPTLASQNQALKKTIEQLQSEIKELKQQNHLAKGYLFNLTTRLYHSQQQSNYLQKERKVLFDQMSMFEQKRIQQKRQEGMLERSKYSYQLPNQRVNLSSSQSNSLYKYLNNKPPSESYIQTDNTHLTHRIQAIKTELTTIYEMKSINGKLRRRKIQLQRQLQNLSLDSPI